MKKILFSLSLILLLYPLQPSQAFFQASSSTTSSTSKIIYLTFDDGPNNTTHIQILDTLKKFNVKATFFLTGQHAEEYPDIVQQTAKDGHAIGNHSYSHPNLLRLKPDEIEYQIKHTNEILKPLIYNQSITVFRAPYGYSNKFIRTYAQNQGMKQYRWTLDVVDWSHASTSTIVNRTVSRAQPGSVVLMHSVQQVTADALPTILTKLKAEGYSFDVLR